MDPQEPVQIVDQNIDFICTIDGGNTNTHANARLIAAAPEMIAALEACVEAGAALQAGKRDGATMGRMSLATDAARALLAFIRGAAHGTDAEGEAAP